MNTKFANSKFPFWREPKGVACILTESEHLFSYWCWGTQGLPVEVLCGCCWYVWDIQSTREGPEQWGALARELENAICSVRSVLDLEWDPAEWGKLCLYQVLSDRTLKSRGQRYICKSDLLPKGPVEQGGTSMAKSIILILWWELQILYLLLVTSL